MTAGVSRHSSFGSIWIDVLFFVPPTIFSMLGACVRSSQPVRWMVVRSELLPNLISWVPSLAYSSLLACPQ